MFRYRSLRFPGGRGVRGGIATAVAATVLASPLAVSGAQPVRIDAEVDRTIFAPATSAMCGFDVYRHDAGTARVVLFPDADGVVVLEIDQNVGWTTTWFSPETGASYSYPGPAQLHTYYEGNEIGDPALAVLTGLQGGTPGATTAGQVIMPSVVVAIGPFGIPDIDQVAPSTRNGTFPGAAELLAARCAALAA